MSDDDDVLLMAERGTTTTTNEPLTELDLNLPDSSSVGQLFSRVLSPDEPAVQPPSASLLSPSPSSPSPSSSSSSSSSSSAASSSPALTYAPSPPISHASPAASAFEIEVSPPETSDGSFVQYSISVRTTLPQYPLREYNVQRRFNDFVWLRERLVDSHPSALVPPLPDKDVNLFNKFDVRLVSFRCRELLRFLLRCTGHPVLHLSPELQTFLTASEEQLKTAQSPPKKESGFFGSLWSSVSKTASSVIASHDEVEPSFAEHMDYAKLMQDAADRLASAAAQFTPCRSDVEAALDNLRKEAAAAAQLHGAARPTAREQGERLFGLVAQHAQQLAGLEAALADSAKISWEDRMRDYERLFAELQRMLEHRNSALAAWQAKQRVAAGKKEELDKAPAGAKADALRKDVETAEKAELEARLNFDTVTAACRNEILRFEAAKDAELNAAVRMFAQCHYQYHTNAAEICKQLLNDA